MSSFLIPVIKIKQVQNNLNDRQWLDQEIRIIKHYTRCMILSPGCPPIKSWHVWMLKRNQTSIETVIEVQGDDNLSLWLH